MTEIRFAVYDGRRREDCLALFDANCPMFFAPNERADFEGFLDRQDADYVLCLSGDALIGAFGVYDGPRSGRVSLNWIMLHPDAQGAGVGRMIMARTEDVARSRGAGTVDIAASHKSAPFFSRFGAVELATIPDGWGPGMHRIDMEWPLSR